MLELDFEDSSVVLLAELVGDELSIDVLLVEVLDSEPGVGCQGSILGR